MVTQEDLHKQIKYQVSSLGPSQSGFSQLVLIKVRNLIIFCFLTQNSIYPYDNITHIFWYVFLSGNKRGGVTENFKIVDNYIEVCHFYDCLLYISPKKMQRTCCFIENYCGRWEDAWIREPPRTGFKPWLFHDLYNPWEVP